MKVKELIEYLKKANPEDLVLIATMDHGGYGSKPGVDVAHTYDGLDWDYGNFYIVGNLDLEVANKKK